MLHQGATVPQLLIRGLSRSPHTTAIVHGDTRLTRQELADQISTYCQALTAQGLGLGRSFALLAPSKLEALVAQFAAQLTGSRMTLLSATSSAEDMLYILTDAQIDYLIIDGEAFPEHERYLSEHSAAQVIRLQGTPDALETLAQGYEPQELQAPEVGFNDLSSIAYTGGTTGRPKGVKGTYRSGATLAQIQMSEWQWPNPSRTLVCTPLTHAGGTLFLPTLLSGGHIVVLDSFTPERFFAAVDEHQITTTMLVPTMINALVRDERINEYDLSSLETIFYGAAPIQPVLLQRALDTFGPVMFQFYGQTECGMTISVLKKEEHTVERLGTCGRPVPWLDVSLRDEQNRAVAVGEVGEICVRGRLVMSGYWNLPEETEQTLRGDWLHTGDLARQDEEGFLTIVDRSKDMIVTGGSNVYSAEVEGVLTSHESVVDAAVVGLPDDYWGEAVTALVVQEKPTEVSEQVLKELVREAKGPIHVPKYVFMVEELPKTPLGKIDKKACTELGEQLRPK